MDGCLSKIHINEKNYKGDKNVELICMMANHKFTDKVIKFKEVNFLNKDSYLKTLSNQIQLYRKENNIKALENELKLQSKDDEIEVRSKASESLSFQYPHFEKLSSLHHAFSRNRISQSTPDLLASNSKMMGSKLFSFTSHKVDKIVDLFDEIISPNIDIDSLEVMKQQRRPIVKLNKIIKKKPDRKSITIRDIYKDYVFIKNDAKLKNDIFLSLSKSNFMKKMKNFSVIKGNNKLFNEYTKYIKDVYNIKPPTIEVFESMNHIRKLSKSNSNPHFKFLTKSSISKLDKDKSRHNADTMSIKRKQESSRNSLLDNPLKLSKTMYNLSKNVKNNLYLRSPGKNCVEDLIENCNNNYRVSHSLLKENVKIYENHGNGLRNTYTKTFSRTNNDFEKNGSLKETSRDFLKQFIEKGNFMYGKGSGYYTSNKLRINPGSIPIKLLQNK